MDVDTLIAGATIITMDGDRRVILDGALAIRGDRIVAVGKREVVEREVRAKTVIDGRRFILTPGLINGHVHLTEALLKGYVPEDLPFDEGLMRWVIPLYEGQTPAEQAIGARMTVLNMLRTGTTCFLEAGTIIAFDTVVEAIAGSGIRGIVGKWVQDTAFAPGDDQRALTDAALRELDDEMVRYPAGDDKLLSAWPILIGHNMNTDACWQGAKAIADTHGAGISAHMSPAALDTAWFVANTGQRPIEHLGALGVLGSNVNIVHMVHASDSEVAMLAETGTSVTHCPWAALKGGYGVTSVGRFPEMAAAGVNLMLGTDGADNSDMMRMIGTAAGLFKDARRDTGLFPAAAAIEMATVNGAKALGMQDRIGSLEPGKKADIVMHDIDRPEWRPLSNPVNQFVWSADGRSVHSVWIDGRRVVDNYRCMTIDEEWLYADAQVAAEALITRSGLPALSAWPVG